MFSSSAAIPVTNPKWRLSPQHHPSLVPIILVLLVTRWAGVSWCRDVSWTTTDRCRACEGVAGAVVEAHAGPQGRVVVSHLCRQVADLKAVAVHMVIEKWEACKLCRRRLMGCRWLKLFCGEVEREALSYWATPIAEIDLGAVAVYKVPWVFDRRKLALVFPLNGSQS